MDFALDRSEILLKAMLWLYPGIGLPVLPPGQIYDKGGRFTNGDRVWVETLTERVGLNPDEHSDFVSLAYAGSHIRDSISKDDILSFYSWLDYISVGSDLMKAALNRKTSAHQPFWNSVAQNMTPEGLQRFETLLKNDVPPSFEYTIESFGENSYYDIKKDSESNLYVIAYGADDYIVDDAIPDNVLETLRTGLETLIKPDKISLHNSKLDLILEELGQKYPDIKVTTVSSGSEMVAQSQEKKYKSGALSYCG